MDFAGLAREFRSLFARRASEVFWEFNRNSSHAFSKTVYLAQRCYTEPKRYYSNCRRPEEPAIQISSLLLRMSGRYVDGIRIAFTKNEWQSHA